MTDAKPSAKKQNVDSLLTSYAESRGYFLSFPDSKSIDDLIKMPRKQFPIVKFAINSVPAAAAAEFGGINSVPAAAEKSAHSREFAEFCQFFAANRESVADLRPAIPTIFVAFLCDLKSNGLLEELREFSAEFAEPAAQASPAFADYLDRFSEEFGATLTQKLLDELAANFLRIPILISQKSAETFVEFLRRQKSFLILNAIKDLIEPETGGLMEFFEPNADEKSTAKFDPEISPKIRFFALENAKFLNRAIFNPSGQFLAAGFEDSSARVWRLDLEAPPLPVPAVPRRHLGAISAADEFDPEKFFQSDPKSTENFQILRGNRSPVFSLEFLTENGFLISGAEDGSVRLFGLQQGGANLAIYEAHNGPIFALDSFDSRFATGGFDGTSRLFDAEFLYPLRIFAGHENSVDSVAIWGDHLLTGSGDKTVKLWDVRTACPQRLYTGLKSRPLALKWSPDRSEFACATASGSIFVFDVKENSLKSEIAATSGERPIYAIDWPMEHLLISGSADGLVKIWRRESAGDWRCLQSATAVNNAKVVALRALKATQFAEEEAESSMVLKISAAGCV